jgi:hypothetical protein
MTCDQQKREFGSQAMILGFGYATTLLVVLGWALIFAS